LGRRFIFGHSGATAIEYALIAALVAVASILAWATLGSDVSSNMETVNAQMADGISPTQDTNGMGKN
jgi:pilus assembly protein Flp/PilA